MSTSATTQRQVRGSLPSLRIRHEQRRLRTWSSASWWAAAARGVASRSSSVAEEPCQPGRSARGERGWSCSARRRRVVHSRVAQRSCR
jgi:hypothetical protein